VVNLRQNGSNAGASHFGVCSQCMNRRILQVTILGTLQSSLNSLDFSLLLPDVITIADEVDAQLTQSMESYMKIIGKSAGA
jgi:hypothetical protein